MCFFFFSCLVMIRVKIVCTLGTHLILRNSVALNPLTFYNLNGIRPSNKQTKMVDTVPSSSQSWDSIRTACHKNTNRGKIGEKKSPEHAIVSSCKQKVDPPQGRNIFWLNHGTNKVHLSLSSTRIVASIARNPQTQAQRVLSFETRSEKTSARRMSLASNK